MKRHLITLSLFLLIFISCRESVESTPAGELPSWVKHVAEDLSAKKGESCEFVWVMIYESQGKRYYNIDFAYSSCSNCNLYDEKGNRVSSSVLANLPEMKITETKPACVKSK